MPTTRYVRKTGNDSTGDGSTGNPWLTINKGLSMMSAGDTLIIGTGTYAETSGSGYLNILKTGTSGAVYTIQSETGVAADVVITGASSATNNTVIRGSYITISNVTFAMRLQTNSFCVLFDPGNSDHITFDHCAIAVTRDSSIRYGVRGVPGASGTFDSITFSYCAFTASSSGSAEGMYFYKSDNTNALTNFLVDHCTFSTDNYPLEWVGVTGSITNSTLISTGTYGANFDASTYATTVTITGTYFQGSTANYHTSGSPTISYSQPPLYVSKSGNDTTGVGSQALPFLTIVKAWSLVVAGNTIWVGDGTYQEVSGSGRWTISKAAASTVTLRAVNPGQVTIQGTSSTTYAVLLSGASNLAFQDLIFSVQSGTSTVQAPVTFDTAANTNISFTGCTFIGVNGSSTNYGVYGVPGSSFTYSGLTFDRCTFNSTGAGAACGGIYLKKGSNTDAVKGLSVTNCTFSVTDYGIRLQGVAKPTSTVGTHATSATQNITSTAGWANGDKVFFATAGVERTIVSVDSGTQVTLDSSLTTADGEVVNNVTNSTVLSGNTISTTSGAGIFLDSTTYPTGATMTNNAVTATNAAYGLQAVGGYYVSDTGSTYSTVYGHGVFLNATNHAAYHVAFASVACTATGTKTNTTQTGSQNSTTLNVGSTATWNAGDLLHWGTANQDRTISTINSATQVTVQGSAVNATANEAITNTTVTACSGFYAHGTIANLTLANCSGTAAQGAHQQWGGYFDLFDCAGFSLAGGQWTGGSGLHVSGTTNGVLSGAGIHAYAVLGNSGEIGFDQNPPAAHHTTLAISDLVVTSAMAHGLIIGTYCLNCTVTRCTIQAGDYGIPQKECDGTVITNCTVRGGSTPSGNNSPLIFKAATNISVSGCRFTRTFGDRASCVWEVGGTGNKCSNITVTGNVFTSYGGPGVYELNTGQDTGGIVADHNTFDNRSGSDMGSILGVPTPDLAAARAQWANGYGTANDIRSGMFSARRRDR